MPKMMINENQFESDPELYRLFLRLGMLLLRYFFSIDGFLSIKVTLSTFSTEGLLSLFSYLAGLLRLIFLMLFFFSSFPFDIDFSLLPL